MVRRLMPWLVASGLFAVAAVALRQRVPGTRAVVERADPVASTPAAAPPETLALPRLAPGETFAAVSAAFDPRVIPRRIAPSWRPAGEAWEWSEPAGRYAVAEFVNGRLAVAQVRRPWIPDLPAVEAARLSALREGDARDQVERTIGRGWPVARAVGMLRGGEIVTCAWAIRDHGVGTGSVLWIGFQDGRAVTIEHPWARR